MNHIQKLLSNIKNIINKLVASGKYDEIKAWQDDVASLEKLNNMFLDVLDELAAKSTDAPTKIRNTDNLIAIGEFKFSTKVSFEEQLNDALSGKLNRRNALYVSETPVLLQEIGMKQLPMLYTQKHLNDAMKPKSSKNSHYHGLTKEQILKMPDIINNPAIIMDSMSQENSIVIVSDVLDNDKAPIIMSIVANGTGVYELENIESNFISSYYGKDNGFESFIDRALKTNNILYISKEKSQSLYRQTGLQLPGGFNKLGYDKIIHQSNNIVNNNSMQKSEKNTTTKSTKRDSEYMIAVKNGDTEAAQKMVDEAAKAAGYKIRAYHGTLSKSFTVFDKSFIGSRFSFDDVGFFFIDRKSIAEDYASSEFDSNKKGTVFDTYLKIKRPLNVNKQFCLSNGLGNPFRDDDVIGVWDSYCDYFKEEAENIKSDGIILDDGTSKMFVVFDSNQIKSADTVTYDNDGNVIPLSERFNEKQEDIRYARKRYWYPDMSNADLEYVKRLAKNELSKTDNYLDNITKWLYNRKNGTSYFALYSTEDENEPTILYASISNQAIAEHNFVMLYLNELEDESDDGKAKAFNEILEDLENTDDLRTVHSGVSSDRRNGNGDVSVHSRPSRSRLSRALLVCLQDSYERRSSGEKINKYSTKRETSISEEASNYILDTKEYQDVIGILERRFNTLGKVKLSPKAIDRYAGRLLQKSNSNYSREQLTERLIALFDFIANSREVTWEEVTELAANIAKDMLTESQTLDRSMQQEYADVLKLMKESRVYISPEVGSEIDHNFGSLEAFRKRLGGKLKITVTDESAVPIDVFWRELSEYRPEMFEADTN